MSLTFRALQVLSASLMAAVSNTKIQTTSGAVIPSLTTTASATWSNVGNTLAFTKVDPNSQIRVDMHGDGYVTGATQTIAEFGVLINGNVYPVAINTHDVVSQRRPYVGAILIPGVPAGTYTVQPQWHRLVGTGTCAVDASNRLWYALQEVQE